MKNSNKIIAVEDYINEKNYGKNWSPKDHVDFFKNNSYNRVFAGADGKLIKQMKRLTAILNDLETDRELKNGEVSYEMIEGFEKLLFKVERQLNKLNVKK